jgi:hypothetical protein
MAMPAVTREKKISIAGMRASVVRGLLTEWDKQKPPLQGQRRLLCAVK